MKGELLNLLIELAREWRENNADPNILCTKLQYSRHLENDECDFINAKTSRSDKIFEIFRFLMSKNEGVYKRLQEICIELNWTDLYNTIQNELTKIDCSHLKMTPDEYQLYKIKSQLLQPVDEKINAHQFIQFDVSDPTVNFIGRDFELKELHKKMQRSGEKDGADAKKIVITEKASAITGLGGIGKTQLALRYVQLYSQYYDNNIVWINAESDATFRNSVINLAENLNINVKHANGVEKETDRILKDVYAHFAEIKCLFVFDNADEPLQCDFYPSSKSEIFILITSRYQKWGEIYVFHLDNFTPEEASDFIRITLKTHTGIHKDQVANLAKTLHYFPLALQQATAYINETSERNKNYLINDYIKEYNESAQKLLSYKFNTDVGNKHFQTTFTTWKITIDKLNGNTIDITWAQKLMKIFTPFATKTAGNRAVAILDCISYFAHEPIDKKIFDQCENDDEYGVAICLLKDYSLVTEENDLLNVHPLVQEVTRLNIKQKKAEKETFTTACKLVVSYFKHLEQSNDYFKQNILLQHSEKLLQEMKNWLIKNPLQQKQLEQESIKNLLIQMYEAYDKLGQQRQVKPVLEQLLSILQTEQYGPDHYEVAITLLDLGLAYEALGQYEKQKTLQERALAIFEKHYGPDHYKIAITLGNLGRTYRALAQPEKVITLLERALVIFEKHYGPDHYEVVITLENLGRAYRALRQPEKETTLLERALAIKEKHYGPDHYELEITLDFLGRAYGDLGQCEKEITFLERALAIKEKCYGPDRYAVAVTLGDLGTAYGALGQPEKEITLQERALAILEKHYGSDHHYVAITLGNLGRAYGALGQPEKAKTLQEKALAIKEKLGETEKQKSTLIVQEK